MYVCCDSGLGIYGPLHNICAAVVVLLLQSRLNGVEGRVAEVREQYAREYRERRRLFNVVQVTI